MVLSPTRTVLRHLGQPDVMPLGQLREDGPMVVRARVLGARIDTHALIDNGAIGELARAAGLSFVFRFGAVVTFGVADAGIEDLDEALLPHVVEPVSGGDVELANVAFNRQASDRIGTDGQILLADTSEARLLLVAIVLARSVGLSRDEDLVAEAFDRIAPLVVELRQTGNISFPIKQAMQMVGEVLGARHRIMGTVQADERPDVLWDHPELDRLYARLEAEYELDDRAEVLEHKFGIGGHSADCVRDPAGDGQHGAPLNQVR
jgi:uncharacterized Rmd1/YagE family protein